MPDATTAASIVRQLRAPDPDSRDVALLRARLYRFSDDRNDYVLAEGLEERLLAGHQLRPSTLVYVRQSLTAIRAHGQPLPFPSDIAADEGIDVVAELAARGPHAWQHAPQSMAPQAVMVIVGAPRSGTSHLFNLLARAGPFSYFTTASCWAWPVRNLTCAQRHLFTAFGDVVLAVDNKHTRIIPGLVMPGEAEDIWARAIPAYRHIAGHRYEIVPAQVVQPEILDAAVRAHAAYFGSPLLLAKSPFSSFRIPQIDALWDSTVRYIHIVRDRRETADSMRRNRIEFLCNSRLLAAEDAWQVFIDAVREHAPADRLLTVTHRDLLADPARVLPRILSWFGHRRSAGGLEGRESGRHALRGQPSGSTPYPGRIEA
jgi:hypothetical protein